MGRSAGGGKMRYGYWTEVSQGVVLIGRICSVSLVWLFAALVYSHFYATDDNVLGSDLSLKLAADTRF